MQPKPFYVTTPIYYVNGKPHIGHAYSTVAADVLSRYARVRGRNARFLTGTDEHGQKIERVAADQGLPPAEYCDRMIPAFRQCWEALHCEYDDFIRTTSPRHMQFAEEMWRRCEAAGDIYLGEYEGWYSVADETFYTEKELVDGKAPTGRPVERVKEPSYFFRLSKYTDKLLAFYEAHPDFVRPEGRFTEVKSFVREGLRDLSLSRTTFRWGIPVPGAPDHVMYVWFDALTNYVSALGGDHAPLYSEFWEPNARAVHLVGKDILRFHAVYWPAFLMSAGLPPPSQVWSHGWMTVNGAKMSKTEGNFLPPEPIADAVGADALRYYLMRDIAFGQDGDFSHQNLLARYHGDLGNGLGNLLNRIVSSIVPKSLDGRVPRIDVSALGDREKELVQTAERAAKRAGQLLDDIAPHRALEAIWELVAAANKYVDQTEPWQLAKKGDTRRLEEVSYAVLESLRWLSVMLWPFLPEKSDAMRAQLGLAPMMPTVGLDGWPSAWGGLVGGTQVRPGAPLFPRFDEDQQRAIYERLGAPMPDALKKTSAGTPAAKSKSEAKKSEPKMEAKPEAKKEAPALPEGVISIDDLVKVDMRLGLVKSGERVPKSDKLLELKVDIGEPEPRTILAGIGKHYEPEQLVGRRIAVVVNLAPRPMMGRTSHGMVLAVSDDAGLSVLSPDKEITPGVKVK
ncbi:methionine--tRNA ligase [Sandaracinus amylolyticus]|uniref:methionine--tRNA ligase n=1 Tax=Sandaracinus amylolyticus TaxID=927083 RepID=UPI001F00F0B7|nr:methionine--tRNA ligase [Sandaracinus amylolyticus]UJR80615.1 Methionyl-tRNA synthetase [Sandaracinus amylolyticus]